MAASHRSPSMRDQRRAGDDHNEDIHHRERGRRAREERSPAASDRRRQGDSGLKIKGIAKPELRTQSSRKSESRRGTEKPRATQRSSRSPQRRDKAEGPPKRTRRPSIEGLPDRQSHRYKDDSVAKRGRTDSRSPLQSPRYKDERRRSRSPAKPSRTDRGPSSRLRDRAYSPLRSPRVDHYSSARDDAAAASRTALDSYIPSNRPRRSRTPLRDEYRPAPSRRRSPSPISRQRPRERSLIPARGRSPPQRQRQPRNNRDIEAEPRAPHSRQHSDSRREPHRLKRKSDPLPTQEEANQASKRLKRSRSPYDRERRRTEGRRMQSSGRPIQSILDNDSRPPSPPRRIPSFDTDYHGSAAGAVAYSVHDASRRPPPVDTRHQYSPSPQWTPVASHHGSPHSASPYGQGRGAWAGQTTQYQGQPGYVV